MREIFFAPSVVVPIVAGIACLSIGWLASIGPLSIAGAVGVVGGLGWMAVRAVFRADAITEKTLLHLKQEALQVEENRLDELAKKLMFDRDYRTKESLTLLRSLKKDFEKATEAPGVELRSMEIVGQVRQLFGAAILQLERSFELFQRADRLTGEQQDAVKAAREKVVTEIVASVDKLQSVTQQYLDLMQKDQQVDMSDLRDELDASLRVAKRTEERMKELEAKPDYESYLKE